MLVRDKHSILLDSFVSYAEIEIMWIRSLGPKLLGTKLKFMNVRNKLERFSLESLSSQV
jgi:hypothetical protein